MSGIVLSYYFGWCGVMDHFFRESCALDEQYVQEYTRLFEQQHITEAELADLSHELLKEIGVTAVGHRIRILKHARFLGKHLPRTSLDKPLSISPHSLPSSYSPDTPSAKIAIDLMDTEADTQPILEQELQTTTNGAADAVTDSIALETPPSPLTTTIETTAGGNNEADGSDISDDEEEEDLPQDVSQLRRQNDFEGVVLMNHLISSRSTSVTNEPFLSSVSSSHFASKLKKYLKRMFMVCQVPPRSHQLKALEVLITDLLKKDKALERDAEPQNYLLQHSIGSGKSLIMAALVYLLATIRVS